MVRTIQFEHFFRGSEFHEHFFTILGTNFSPCTIIKLVQILSSRQIETCLHAIHWQILTLLGHQQKWRPSTSSASQLLTVQRSLTKNQLFFQLFVQKPPQAPPKKQAFNSPPNPISNFTPRATFSGFGKRKTRKDATFGASFKEEELARTKPVQISCGVRSAESRFLYRWRWPFLQAIAVLLQHLRRVKEKLETDRQI